MRVALASDLHLEFHDLELINEGADVLILAGDILLAADLHRHPEEKEISSSPSYRQSNAYRFRDFIKRASLSFPEVVVIAGNHEFYDGKWFASIDYLREEYSKFSNVHYLERDTCKIGDVQFVGGTLWTNVNRGDPLDMHVIGDMMQDFRLVRNDDAGYTRLRVAHTIHRHIQTLGYFKFILSENKNNKFIVVSHHAPSSLSIDDRYKDQKAMNSAYYSDLSEFILDHPQIALWCHGHVHTKFDYLIGDTRVVCNPRGYYGYEPEAMTFGLKYIDV